uniref:Uncharacterized protein n=1 Tax=Nelumbo nucifera TaxID=4432 RepID=A0A822ZYD0_NELNU|nr:TPA_asm: hypothetical protein HUJ06_018086 [Nelumbo nucifera]
MESDIWNFLGRMPYKFGNQTGTPVVLEWAIGNQTCGDPRLQVNYACRNNTECINSTGTSGYL